MINAARNNPAKLTNKPRTKGGETPKQTCDPKNRARTENFKTKTKKQKERVNKDKSEPGQAKKR